MVRLAAGLYRDLISKMSRIVTQINWQRQLGGGEIYTRFFTRALQSLGWEVHVVVDRKASFWQEMGLDGVRFIPIKHGREIPDVLPKSPSLVVSHMTLPPDMATFIAQRHRLGGFVHMPLHERLPGGLAGCHAIFPVSAYVRDTALARGLHQVHREPLLGVADLEVRAVSQGPIIRRSEFDWDRRKFRDRALSWCEPLRKLGPRALFSRRDGITLGIVSRLTPIKQFPSMFALLSPVLADFPQVNLEIFGSGGYASLRDLRRTLGPIRDRVRFWGHQPDPAAIYPLLDYVLSGLPEREALGLNLIEAQSCGTPVLAVNAPPFTETVIDTKSGFLYPDPRLDGGIGIRDLMHRLQDGSLRPDPRRATEHLEKFSRAAFQARVGRAMELLAG